MQGNTKEKYSINARFIQFLEYKNITRYTFSKETGVSEVTLGNIAKMKTKISTDVIQKLLNNYEVSADWLFTGEGEMLKKESSSSNIVSKPVEEGYSNSELQQQLIELQKKHIELLTQKDGPKNDISERLDDLSDRLEEITDFAKSIEMPQKGVRSSPKDAAG